MQNTGIILKLIKVTHHWMREEGPIVLLYTETARDTECTESLHFIELVHFEKKRNISSIMSIKAHESMKACINGFHYFVPTFFHSFHNIWPFTQLFILFGEGKEVYIELYNPSDTILELA